MKTGSINKVGSKKMLTLYNPFFKLDKNILFLGNAFDDYSQFIGMRIGCLILGMMAVPFR